MGQRDYTVLFKKGGTHFKLCKIIFGGDGSYYVTVPYHSESKGIFYKTTFNYNEREMVIPDERALDIGSSDQARIKLSHHPSGFIQFSGKGLISGKDKDGKIKGMGVMSWPLTNPIHGPAFALVIFGIEGFEQETKPKGRQCIIEETELPSIPGENGLALEGHYFPPLARRFIQRDTDGSQAISIVHPLGILMRLRVLRASDSCALPGFIGLHASPIHAYIGKAKSGYFLSSSTGNIRFNEKGEKLGDGVFCSYPRLKSDGIRRILDYTNTPPATI